MELVSNTTRRHPDHGEVHIENIYREYASYDTADGGGSIPGAWYVAYSTDRETLIDPVQDFIEDLSR